MLDTVLATLVTLGALCALACLRSSSRRPGMRAAIGATVVSVLAGVWFGSDDRLPFRAAPPAGDRVLEIPQHEYATSSQCRSCHPGQYATWHDSYHSTMTQVVSPDTVLGTFDGELEVRGEPYRLDRVGDDYWGTFDVIPGDGSRTTHRVKLVQVTGSHHIQVYWYQYGDARGLGMFPLYFHLEEQRWIPWSSVFLMIHEDTDDEDVGRWNVHCLKCHTTDARPKVLADDPATIAAATTEVGEYGITCEACHGPGETHASVNRNPVRRYLHHFSDGADETITNPVRLDAKRSAHVCAQCHSVNAILPKKFPEGQEKGSPYRPGADLEATHVVFGGRRERGTLELARSKPRFMESHFWSDGMVRIGGREFNGLQRSPCYTHGDRELGIMDCTSCHTAHQAPDDPRTPEEWANDQLALETRSNGSCLQCHEQYATDEALAAHTNHGVESVGSTCINCHMPHTSWGLMKATRSHEVSSPSIAAQVATGRPNACSLCHLDQTLTWANDRLVDWYGVESVELEGDDADLPAGVVAGLRGDAGQRAITAWVMGWEPAMAASGTGWRERILATLLLDPYDAVRFNAVRSLRKQPGFEDFDVDFLGTENERRRAMGGVLIDWRERASTATVEITDHDHDRLLSQRDDKVVYLSE